MTDFKTFLKGIFVQEGSSGARFDHGKFEIKTLSYLPLSYCILPYFDLFIFLCLPFADNSSPSGFQEWSFGNGQASAGMAC